MNCSLIKRSAAVLLLAAAALSAPVAARSEPTVVKMATLAPEGSSWFRVLQEMGEEWRKASDGVSSGIQNEVDSPMRVPSTRV